MTDEEMAKAGVLITTCWGLSVRKLQSQLMIRRFTSITTSFRIMRCGWMVLKAKEKSRSRSLVWVPGCSRCSRMEWMTVMMASSEIPLLEL
ncbi:hypothetical protein ACOMHN_011815 [Nucella lapillus]